ncbi:hypothetical protein FRC08_015222, partial [Ceratobasidium sp. 394]
MASVDFNNLPPNVSRDVFYDTIAKFLDVSGSVANRRQPFVVNLELPEETSPNLKNKDGTGSIWFYDGALLQKFLTKLATEPIMFRSETVKFTHQNPDPADSSLPAKTSGTSSQNKAEHIPHATPRTKVARSHTSPVK